MHLISPSDQWYLDEMVVRIAGKRMYCGAVDQEGELLDMLVQSRRDKRAALRLCRLIRHIRTFSATKPVLKGWAPTVARLHRLGAITAGFATAI
jgi:transposase-like protein